MDELWKPISGYEGLYEVSNLGRVRGMDRIIKSRSGATRSWKARILKPGNTPFGYLHVSLCNDGHIKHKTVHRLVADHFLPSPLPECIQINHLDSDKHHNAAPNLEWCTASQNYHHCVSQGRRKPPAFLRPRKLNPTLAAEIRKLQQSGVTYKSLRKLFNISNATIHRVVRFIIWKHGK